MDNPKALKRKFLDTCTAVKKAGEFSKGHGNNMGLAYTQVLVKKNQCNRLGTKCIWSIHLGGIGRGTGRKRLSLQIPRPHKVHSVYFTGTEINHARLSLFSFSGQ